MKPQREVSDAGGCALALLTSKPTSFIERTFLSTRMKLQKEVSDASGYWPLPHRHQACMPCGHGRKSWFVKGQVSGRFGTPHPLVRHGLRAKSTDQSRTTLVQRYHKGALFFLAEVAYATVLTLSSAVQMY